MSIDERLREILIDNYAIGNSAIDNRVITEIKKVIAEELPQITECLYSEIQGIFSTNSRDDSAIKIVELIERKISAYRNELLSKLGVKDEE